MCKILIIDDDPMTLRMISFMLKKLGYAAVSAESGSEGISLIGEEQPDMVLLDVEMPDENGIDVLRRLRGDRVIGDIKVCLMTGTPDENVRTAADELGAVGCIAKPVEAAALSKVLDDNFSV